MNKLFFLFLLFLANFSIGQVHFELLERPTDLRIQSVAKSPQGEYYLMTSVNDDIVFHSTNGITWTTETLPSAGDLEDVQFMSDGTLIANMNAVNVKSLIRRNGKWHTSEYSTICINNDTLYAYSDSLFFFSIDRGKTFKLLFEDSKIDKCIEANLAFINGRLILHYLTPGRGSTIKVYKPNGEIITEYLGQSQVLSNFVVTDCGIILVHDYSSFDISVNFGSTFHSGDFDDLKPTSFPGSGEFHAAENVMYYYGSWHGALYYSVNCSFDWKPFYADIGDVAPPFLYCFPDSTVLLSDFRRRSFHDVKLNQSEATYTPDIAYPSIYFINESINEFKTLITSSDYYYMPPGENIWYEIYLHDSLKNHYSVDFDQKAQLYLYNEARVLRSDDFGMNFQNIPIPTNQPRHISTFKLISDSLYLLSSLNDQYYTSNGGASWKELPEEIKINYREVIYRRVGNSLYLIEYGSSSPTLKKLNLETSETESHYFSNMSTFFAHGTPIILSDGHIFLTGHSAINPQDSVGLYRINTDLTIDYLDNPVPNIEDYQLHTTSKDEIVVFDGSLYNYWHSSNGEIFSQKYMTGLSGKDPKFSISHNDYIYCITENTFPFRSSSEVVSTIDNSNDYFAIYPNPCNEHLFVELDMEDATHIKKLHITNLHGQICKTVDVSSSKFVIDVENLPTGVYFINSISSIGSNTGKIFIKK